MIRHPITIAQPITAGPMISLRIRPRVAYSRRMARRPAPVRREEIMQAACAVIARRGFAQTRVTDVAQQAGVSPALVFYHFASKDQLLSESFAWAAQDEFEALDQIKQAGGTATARLVQILDVYAPPRSSRGWRLWIDAWASALRNPALQLVSRKLDARWQQEMAAVITEGVTAGEFRCDDPHAAAWRLGSLLDGLAIQVVVHRGLITYEQMRRWGREAAAREVGLDGATLDDALLDASVRDGAARDGAARTDEGRR
jgi:AcrR family transcriptional regulator